MIPLSSPTQCTIELTQECSLKCVHCYRCDRQASDHQLKFAEVIELLTRFERVGVMDVLFEGGDPFARADIYDIVDFSTQRFVTKLSTNGTLIDQPGARRLAHAGVAAVFVTILGSNATLHDSLTGVPGSFRRSTNAVLSLLAAGIRAVMVNVPMKPNLNDLPAYLQLAHDLGVRYVSLIGLYALGRARENWNSLAPHLEEVRHAFMNIHSTPEVYVDHRYYPHIHNCCSQAYTVTADGRVIGCPYLREVAYYGNTRSSDLLAMWNSESWRQVRYGKVHGKCQSCELFSGNCGGGCRASALQYTGDFLASDPLCWKPHQDEGRSSDGLIILK